MNPDIDDENLVLQYYPDGMYNYFVQQQGEVVAVPEADQKPPRRRRRKSKKGDQEDLVSQKRKLTDDQVNALERCFGNEHKLESERKDRLAAELGLDPRQVAVWFQNRRVRWKTKKMEEEYSRLKSEHETTVVEKCRLETKVLEIQEKLNEAEKEIQRLSERSDGLSSNSPSSSFSIEHMGPPFLGEFGMEGLERVLQYDPYHEHDQMEWKSIFDM